MLLTVLLVLHHFLGFVPAAELNVFDQSTDEPVAVEVDLNAVATGRDLLAAEGELWPLNEASRDRIVAEHNRVRSETAQGKMTGKGNEKLPAASNLGPLNWSASLAQVATEWVERCQFKHRDDCGGALIQTNLAPTELSGYSQGDACGENIAADTRPASLDTVIDGIKGWAEEVKDFEYGIFPQEDWSKTGHFSAMIWADTKYVGCGVKKCPEYPPGGTFLVCNYYPAGNMRGAVPYEKGTPPPNGGEAEEGGGAEKQPAAETTGGAEKQPAAGTTGGAEAQPAAGAGVEGGGAPKESEEPSDCLTAAPTGCSTVASN